MFDHDLAPGKDMRGWHTHTASPLHSEPMLRSRRNLNRSPPKGTCWPADRIPARAEHMPPLPGHGLVPTAPVRSARRARVRCGCASLHRAQARRARRVRRTARHVHVRAWGGVSVCSRVWPRRGCHEARFMRSRSHFDSAVRARRGREDTEGGGREEGGRRRGRARCGTVHLAAAVRCGASAVHTGPWPTPDASVDAKKFNTK